MKVGLLGRMLDELMPASKSCFDDAGLELCWANAGQTVPGKEKGLTPA
jgi:hypothetical protein